MWRGTVIDDAISKSFDWDMSIEKKLQRSISNSEMEYDSLSIP
jgi:hypothetical protein